MISTLALWQVAGTITYPRQTRNTTHAWRKDQSLHVWSNLDLVWSTVLTVKTKNDNRM